MYFGWEIHLAVKILSGNMKGWICPAFLLIPFHPTFSAVSTLKS